MHRFEFLAQGPPSSSSVAELRLTPYSSDLRATPWPRQPLSVPRDVSAKTTGQGEKGSRQNGSQHSVELGWRPCWCTEARVECGVAVQACLLTPNAQFTQCVQPSDSMADLRSFQSPILPPLPFLRPGLWEVLASASHPLLCALCPRHTRSCRVSRSYWVTGQPAFLINFPCGTSARFS